MSLKTANSVSCQECVYCIAPALCSELWLLGNWMDRIYVSLQFARQLVRMNYSKVCVLSGGAGVLRTLGLLTSLHDDP